MFILLNNVPINTLDITKVSSVFKVSPTHIFPHIQEGYRFSVEMKDKKRIISKLYKTEDEAVNSMKNLLFEINTDIAELPVISI